MDLNQEYQLISSQRMLKLQNNKNTNALGTFRSDNWNLISLLLTAWVHGIYDVRLSQDKRNNLPLYLG